MVCSSLAAFSSIIRNIEVFWRPQMNMVHFEHSILNEDTSASSSLSLSASKVTGMVFFGLK